MKRIRFLKLISISPFLFMLKSCFTSPESGLVDEVEGNPFERSKVLQYGITNNHGHTEIDLTAEDIINANFKTYYLTGGNHQHEFVLNSDQFDQLNNDQEINVLISVADHFHFIGMKFTVPNDE